MRNERAINVCFGVVLAIALGLLCGCAKQPSERTSESSATGSAVEKKEAPVLAPPPPVDTEALDPKQVPQLPPPKPAEVTDVVNRVFKQAAVADTSHKSYFLVGDFNGDYSQDIAVIIKPVAGKLSEMNQEYPPWILKDPFNPNLPPQLRKEPLRVEEKDVLLAVIHGYGANGWRNPEAMQTYLLKGAVGADFNTQPAKGLVAANRDKKLPKLIGDAISEVLEGTLGFLYYTGAAYAWYDPKTYKPDSETRMAHSGMTGKQ
jgi:hypothetical protein